ncbi:hypothetical protein BDCR2A_01479 [Borrelia duttonii CR2A]|uniref:Uncharacterized protein n=1 Tax=Borrelia duttonii CR2A TaxID=1432657 RepID=W6TGT8_9SPIR|nr:hypothetical protein BDCR2A_01479 [Borrelia duttonii CR2A]
MPYLLQLPACYHFLHPPTKLELSIPFNDSKYSSKVTKTPFVTPTALLIDKVIGLSLDPSPSDFFATASNSDMMLLQVPSFAPRLLKYSPPILK